MALTHQSSSRWRFLSAAILLILTVIQGFVERTPSLRIHPLSRQPCILHIGARTRSKCFSSNDDESSEFIKNEGRKAVQDLIGEEALQKESSSEASDELLAEVYENQPSGFQVASDVMGFNALTYVLAFLVVLSGAANAFFGDGWLLPIVSPGVAQEQREAVNARRQQVIDPRTFPSGYQDRAPSTEELLRNIPAEDLTRLQEGNLPTRDASTADEAAANFMQQLKGGN